MLLTFGEIMLRLSPEGFLRFRQSMPGRLEATFAGAEANAAAFSAIMGAKARFATALPDNDLAECVMASLRSVGIETSAIKRMKKGRLGIFFCETGANQRASQVIYDRDSSAIATASETDYDFDSMLDSVSWLHVTGITPSLSQNAFKSSLALVKAASEKGIKVSIDLNFRKKLWKWEPGTESKALASKCMDELVKYAYMLVANEEDAGDVFGIRPEVDGESNRKPQDYTSVAKRIYERHPNLSMVAITLRESISATHNNWGAALFLKDGSCHFGPQSADGSYAPYEISSIVDRVGAGDSFAGSLIYALMSKDFSDPAQAIRFAAAASCLKHSIKNDFALMSKAEVIAVMNNQCTGRISR